MSRGRQSPRRVPRPTLAAVFLVLATLSGALLAGVDVRLLIDVSGSMKQNDPGNLRVPALRLVTELLPAGAAAGVWLFAEKTEALAPAATVDEDWKRQARSRLGRVHSRGLLTDIEQAIETAIADWGPDTGGQERHLVLLTDGLVDVSKDPGASAKSRERIASSLLERLKDLDVKVNAVALSDNVDMDLMRILSEQTGGWLETAKDADALQRVFLHMLEQTAAPTTVPLKGNAFEIDDQVSELTLLAFRAEGGETKLIAPDRGEISAKALPRDAVWRAEAGYDMVTIPRPQPGSWLLQGVEDPDNRVVVVTDLGIDAGPIPTSIAPGQTPAVEVWVTEHQRPVKRAELLGVLTAEAELSGGPPTAEPTAAADPSTEAEAAEAAGQTTPAEGTPPAVDPGASELAADAALPRKLALPLDGETGRFTARLMTEDLQAGAYELRLVIDGGTFQRQIIRRFRMTGPLLSLSSDRQDPTESDPTAAITLKIDGEPEHVDATTLMGYVLVKGPKDREQVVEIPDSAQLPLGIKIPVTQPGDYVVSATLLARTLAGQAIETRPAPQTLSFAFEAPPPAEDASEAAEQDPDDGIHWLELGAYLGVGNVLLGALLGLLWWRLTGRESKGEKDKAKAKAKPKKAKTAKRKKA